MANTGSINADKYKITQHFGEDPAYYAKYGYKGHPGLDTGQRTGNPVYCDEDIRINGIYKNAGSAGNMVTGRSIRKTPTQGEWRYLHLSKFSPRLKVGRVHKRGLYIGYAGSTGDANGPHNHEDYKPVIPGTNVPLAPWNGYGGRRNPLLRLKRYKRK